MVTDFAKVPSLLHFRAAGQDLNLEVTLPQLVTLMSYAAIAGKSAGGGAA
jgi:hypothetical protein